MLKIIKKGNKNFTHIDPDFPNQYGANDITIIFDGNTVKLRSFNGRVIFKRDGYDLSEVMVIDDSASSAEETFTDVNLLKQRLISLGYPFACNGGGGDGPSSGIEDIFAGDNINVDKTDPNNPIISANVDNPGVESVTGDGVDNSDPLNPIVSYPDANDLQSIRPLKTINGETIEGSGDIQTGGGSQWDDVTGGINYANGNVSVDTTSGSFIIKDLGAASVALQSSATLGIQASSNIRFYTGGTFTEVATLLVNGNFGIGNTNPDEKLVINGNAKSDKFITQGGTDQQVVSGDGTLIDISDFSTQWTTTANGINYSDGNVGINTSANSSFPLDIRTTGSGDLGIRIRSADKFSGIRFEDNFGANTGSIYWEGEEDLFYTPEDFRARKLITLGGTDQQLVAGNGDLINIADLPSGGGGDVNKVGTPSNNQVAVWTGDGTIEGDGNFTWDSDTQTLDVDFKITTGVVELSQLRLEDTTTNNNSNISFYTNTGAIRTQILSDSDDFVFYRFPKRRNVTGAVEEYRDVVIEVILSGDTSKRPDNLNSDSDVGLKFFDTDLNRPIWWNGTTWVDFDTNEWAEYTGSWSNQDGVLKLGDVNDDNNGTKIIIDDDTSEIAFEEAYVVVSTDYQLRFNDLTTNAKSTTLTADADGTQPEDIDLFLPNNNSGGNVISLNRSGTTAERPNWNSAGFVKYIGESWFDTTLGKPVWWTGTEWVDSQPKIGFIARTSNSPVVANNWTAISFQTIEYNYNNSFDGTVFTVPEDGIYEVYGLGTFANVPNGENNIVMVWRNGNRGLGGLLGRSFVGGTGLSGHGAAVRLVCNAGDTLDMRCFVETATTMANNGANQDGYNTFSVFKL